MLFTGVKMETFKTAGQVEHVPWAVRAMIPPHGQGPLQSSTDLLSCENERGKAKNVVGLLWKLVPLQNLWKGLGDPQDSQVHRENPTLPCTGFVIACNDDLTCSQIA